MNYKALICDLDGTTIPNSRDAMPTKVVLEAITKAKEKLFVTVATARPYFFAHTIVRELDLTGPAIFHNGARIIDVSDNSVLWEQTINPDATLEACAILLQSNTRITINEDGYDQTYSNRYIPRKPLSIFVNNIEPTAADLIIRELHTIPTLSALTFAGYKKDTLGIVISHVGATKQHAILKLSMLLNIDTKEIIGIGDSQTDFPLLMACGLKVAMGNAEEDLKAIADYIAPSVDEDGVADVINRFVLSD